jgi:uncharacterized protein YcfJ
MKTFTKHAIALAVAAFATQAAAQVTLYEREGFEGAPITSNQSRTDSTYATSVVVMDNNTWEVCEDTQFRGACTRLMNGRYPTVASMGLRRPVASIRVVDDRRTEYRDSRDDRRAEYRDVRGYPRDERDFSRRGGERVYDVPVGSVRAVVGAAEQRCWVEREQVSAPSRPSVPGAIAGVIIGGILGHQVGSGTTQDVARSGGAVAGGFIGANAGRSGPAYQDVQRCTNVSSQTPSYYEVTYVFRGQEHRVQMSTPPGPTIQVNESGEPRA